MAAEDTDEGEERLDAHLQDIEDGCGCTEVWEHTSASRDEASSDAAADAAVDAADD
jgi:hypothetical protein